MFLDKLKSGDATHTCDHNCSECTTFCPVQIKGNRPGVELYPTVGSIFPNFLAPSSDGYLNFHEWAEGSWVHVFSEPDSLGPVGSSEMIQIGKKEAEFTRLGLKNLCLSAMQMDAQLEWLRTLEQKFKMTIDVTMAVDATTKLMKILGMEPSNEPGRSTNRKSYIIGPSLRVMMIFEYPALVGRSIDEVIRVVDAFQTVMEVPDVCVPADWHEGTPLLLRSGVSQQEAHRAFGNGVIEVLPYFSILDI